MGGIYGTSRESRGTATYWRRNSRRNRRTRVTAGFGRERGETTSDGLEIAKKRKSDGLDGLNDQMAVWPVMDSRRSASQGGRRGAARRADVADTDALGRDAHHSRATVGHALILALLTGSHRRITASRATDGLLRNRCGQPHPGPLKILGRFPSAVTFVRCWLGSWGRGTGRRGEREQGHRRTVGNIMSSSGRLTGVALLEFGRKGESKGSGAGRGGRGRLISRRADDEIGGLGEMA
ncbi:hypothetical protein BO70DRAFT_122791 [Aspergillus heteromorphus CBS 117.55]|uniref:Uncharacterized protein n=1 Tax=Aspergillus heteromorphus CBS 117.55 TaxID=1448321 RepID=A0A317VAR3_9EURO|nr:uncharacterized protein BO70DRAFT_122791 [Aspergillus heteromorphus CBS 117.55]PWY71444.1 hypothetical protein BO70DRAFT_122791 [Aspergillus heteromorphus CBS 117.55]